MFESTHRKSHSYTSSECYFKDMVKICSKWNGNCWNYAACCYKKHASLEQLQRRHFVLFMNKYFL